MAPILKLDEIDIDGESRLGRLVKEIQSRKERSKLTEQSDSYSDVVGYSDYSDIGYSDSYGPG